MLKSNNAQRIWLGPIGLFFISFVALVILSPFLFALMINAADKEHIRKVREALCIKNLREISRAKKEWLLENQGNESIVPTANALAKYLSDQSALRCPAGGTYSIKLVKEPPTCSIAKHKLPD